MIHAIPRATCMAFLFIMLGSCKGWKLGAGGFGSADGVLICSVTDQTIGPQCGNANIYLCNNNGSAKKVSVTRRFSFGDDGTYTAVYTTPANANTYNKLAPFIGRDEYGNKDGLCMSVNYDLTVLPQ